jgi:hypothetical protein
MVRHVEIQFHRTVQIMEVCVMQSTVTPTVAVTKMEKHTYLFYSHTFLTKRTVRIMLPVL